MICYLTLYDGDFPLKVCWRRYTCGSLSKEGYFPATTTDLRLPFDWSHHVYNEKRNNLKEKTGSQWDEPRAVKMNCIEEVFDSQREMRRTNDYTERKMKNKSVRGKKKLENKMEREEPWILNPNHSPKRFIWCWSSKY